MIVSVKPKEYKKLKKTSALDYAYGQNENLTKWKNNY
jgi:hypothetical protein